MNEFKQIICTRIWQIYAFINYKKMVVRYVGQIGLPVINFHGLRHKSATLLIAQNIGVAVVVARLGHAQIATTYNFNAHHIISHNKKAGYALEDLLLSQKLI